MDKIARWDFTTLYFLYCDPDQVLVVQISERDHMANVEMSSRCNTFSIGSCLQSKRLRWRGPCNPGRPTVDCLTTFCLVKSKVNVCEVAQSHKNIAWHDEHACYIKKCCRDAQKRSLWKDRACPHIQFFTGRKT